MKKKNQTEVSPLSNIEMESDVLGCFLLGGDAFGRVNDIIKRDTFVLESHKYIFDAVAFLYDQNEPIDIRTVYHKIRKMKLGDMVDISFLTSLMSRVNSTANLESWAYLLVEFELKRNVHVVSENFKYKAMEMNIDALELVTNFETEVSLIGGRIIRKETQSAEKVFFEYFKVLNHKYSNPNLKPTGVLGGFAELDDLTGGFNEGNLIVVAGRPGMGKTAFALSMAWDAAKKQGKSVAFFSLEMEAKELIERMAAMETEINSNRVRRAKLANYEFENIIHFGNSLANYEFYIDDTPALSLSELKSKARKLKQKNNIDIIFIDYLQLMTDSNKSNFNRETEVAAISRGLKKIAKELKIPIVAMAQLSRASEVRGGDKKPQLSDLRESGSIEQDADMVILLYRSEYYGLMQDAEGNSTQGQAEVILAKNRSGATGNIIVNFKKEITKFSDPKQQATENIAAAVQTFENEKSEPETPW